MWQTEVFTETLMDLLAYHTSLDILWLLAWDNRTQNGQWSWFFYQILCNLGQHHFLICLLENFLLVFAKY